MNGFKKDLLTIGLFLAGMLILPWCLTNEYYVNVLIISGLNAIVAVGLNLLLGFAGQISLGHAAFYGLAAYTTSILTTTYNLPIIVGILAGIFLVGLVAYLIGIPALKLSGHYLAMATLGFGIIVYIVFNETIELTGGPSGFVGIPRLSLFGYSFDSDLSYYYLVVSVLAIVLMFLLT